MSMKRATLMAIVIIVAIIVVVSATAAYLLVVRPGNTGEVKMFVKDSTGIWAHVNVTFSQVEIHRSGNDSGWKNFTFDKSRIIDLTAFVNISALLADGKFATGQYTQIRIVVDSVVGTMTNGTVVNFKVPSGELKINKPFSVASGKTTTITVDIDLSNSIVHSGSDWKFKPVLGSVEVVNPTSGGGITY